MMKFESAFINEIVNSTPRYRSVIPTKSIIVPQETLNTYFHSKFRDIVKSFKLQNEVFDLISYSSISVNINREIKNRFCNLISNVKLRESIKEIKLNKYINSYEKAIDPIPILEHNIWHRPAPHHNLVHLYKMKVVDLKKVIRNFKKKNPMFSALHKVRIPSIKKDLIKVIYDNLRLTINEIQAYLILY